MSLERIPVTDVKVLMTVTFQVNVPTITSLKDFLHEVFEEGADVSVISEVHSGSPLRWRWGE